MSIRTVLFPNPASCGTRRSLLPTKNGPRLWLCLPRLVGSASSPSSGPTLIQTIPAFRKACTSSCVRGAMVARRAPGETIRNRCLSFSTNTTQTASGRRKLPIGSTDCVYRKSNGLAQLRAVQKRPALLFAGIVSWQSCRPVPCFVVVVCLRPQEFSQPHSRLVQLRFGIPHRTSQQPRDFAMRVTLNVVQHKHQLASWRQLLDGVLQSHPVHIAFQVQVRRS